MKPDNGTNTSDLTLTFFAYSVIFFGEEKKSTLVASLNWICSYAFSIQPAISSL